MNMEGPCRTLSMRKVESGLTGAGLAVMIGNCELQNEFSRTLDASA